MNVALPTPFPQAPELLRWRGANLPPFFRSARVFYNFFGLFQWPAHNPLSTSALRTGISAKKGNQFNAFSRKRKITERKIAVPALGGAAAAPKQGKAHGRAHGPTQGGNTQTTISHTHINKIVPIYIANINTRCYLCTLITTKKHDQNNFTGR